MISVIIPFKNEADSLPVLLPLLEKNLEMIDTNYEVLLLSNGSTDEWEKNLILPNEKFKTFTLRRGDKGRALRRGLSRSTGDIIVFMDADLEDNPKDLSKFYEKIKEGADFVNGWRRHRKHTWDKIIPSYIGNTLIIRSILRSSLHDINCGFKMFRRECLRDVVLYGDNFRFLPLVVEKFGFRTAEVVVSHKNRQFGKSKYGFFNRLTVFADILTAYFIYRFSQKPLHFFAAIGMLPFVAGSFLIFVLAVQRIFFGIELHDRPIVWAAILLIIVGLQIIMTGVIAELMVFLFKKGQRA
ncbi:glycosyltransferase [Candidatus Woesebacteria bacterium]|nr:glycosyltransferase [Candidatus Woesebacteria bacterium]